MIVTLDNAYRSEFLFLPARNKQEELRGLEIIANFAGVNTDVRIPTELVIPHLSPEQELALFQEKLAVLDACKLFFIQHQLTAWINITPIIVEFLLTNQNIVSIIEQFPFVEFTISEGFPDLNKGKDNHTLVQLAQCVPIVLANFGAGDTTTKAIFDGLFSRIILDRNFIQQRLAEYSFEPFMRVIMMQIMPYCQSIMITGIDNSEAFQRAAQFDFCAMQGCLWPAVPVETVTSLVQR